MHEPDRSLGFVTKAMREGSILNGVVFSLAKVAKGMAIEQQDKQVIEGAIEYLDNVKAGYNWMQNPRVSTQSRISAFSFDTAATSWSSEASSPEQFLEDIDSIIETLKSLGSTDPPADESFDKTRLFFDRVFRHSIERFSRLSPSPEIPELQ
jgi:hypothetical protein